ncbi:tRNA(fMet)-specific endonuclease VapC [Paucibacter oligotrophus]|uniref:Ribonuclease VapC n=1 Tax=Roseateles oligotrophus TaxID=1769250 RepID=A0A840L714_9BURK|nr:type II toxin-antitoxin system VapC family toxin [Roseateles oligotrophus]MBB4841949.1 tRNA(fMet)-specific endonuclease VapC [Roseateles oligotrophus]
MSVAATLYLLDTNIISQLMRQPTGAAMQRLAALHSASSPAKICTSVLVQCELCFGLRLSSSLRLQRRYEEAMRYITVLALDATVAEPYALLRSRLQAAGTPIGPHDTLIAAHALALGATLVTADAEFQRVPGLTLENWT